MVHFFSIFLIQQLLGSGLWVLAQDATETTTIYPNDTTEYPSQITSESTPLYQQMEVKLDNFMCVKKVMMIEEIVYDHEIRCNHIDQEECYLAFKTIFTPKPNQECRDHFKKDCFIEYQDVAKVETVRICSTRKDRVCNLNGVQPSNVCTEVFDTVCETKYLDFSVVDQKPICRLVQERICNEQNICKLVPVNKCEVDSKARNEVIPETQCQKVPSTVCGPEACPIVDKQVCQDQDKTIVSAIPREHCEMKPYEICTNSTIVLPSLQQVEECVQVPKEVCAYTQGQPMNVMKPVVKNYCYRPPIDPSNGDKCEDGWFYQASSNKCYFLQQQPQSLNSSIYSCLNLDASLVSISDPEEMAALLLAVPISNIKIWSYLNVSDTNQTVSLGIPEISGNPDVVIWVDYDQTGDNQFICEKGPLNKQVVDLTQ